MKKNQKSQQNSLDAFLSGKSYNTTKNNSKPTEKQEKKESQPSILAQEKMIKKSKKRENPPEDAIIEPKKESKEQMNENIITKDKTQKEKQKAKGNSILFKEIVDVLLKVEQCKGENSKDAVKELLSNLFFQRRSQRIIK